MKFNIIKKNKLFVFSAIFIFLVFFTIMYYDNETNELVDYENSKYNIEKDGIQILYDPESKDPESIDPESIDPESIDPESIDPESKDPESIYSINLTKHSGFPSDKIKSDVLTILPPDYVFLDYIYTISGNSLSTFHRDVTSSSKIYNTEFPVYTMILYKTTGELLSFCPNSHNTYPFVWSNIVNITGKGGTVFVFDSELLHAGSTDNCEKRYAIQYKICHRNDISKLSHLNGIRAKKESDCSDSSLTKWIYRIFRKISYYFELPINTVFYPIMVEKQDGFIGWVQDMIPIKYYNNI
jgi:hypothetical protein